MTERCAVVEQVNLPNILRSLVFVLAGLAVAAAQSAPTRPSFEVASVRIATQHMPGEIIGSFSGGPGTSDPERFVGREATLKQLMVFAYQLKTFQIIGPAWIDDRRGARYDVIAKLPEGALKHEVREMLQALLRERFGLVTHIEHRDFPVYELIVKKNGPRLKAAAPDAEYTSQNVKLNLALPGMLMSKPIRGGLVLTGHRITMSSFAHALEFYVSGFTVVDQTGLSGSYDIEIQFASSDLPAQASDSMLADLPTVLEQDLGLRLRKTSAPFEVTIVDHADKIPAEN